MSSSLEVLSVFVGLVLFVCVVSFIKVVFNWKMTMGRLLSLAVLVLLVSIAHYANISKQVAASDTESQEAVTRQETTRQEQNLTVLRSAVAGNVILCVPKSGDISMDNPIAWAVLVESSETKRTFGSFLSRSSAERISSGYFEHDQRSRSNCEVQIVRGSSNESVIGRILKHGLTKDPRVETSPE